MKDLSGSGGTLDSGMVLLEHAGMRWIIVIHGAVAASQLPGIGLAPPLTMASSAPMV